jgi:fructose-1-phosphate kinase PfkB-like protein
MSKILTLTTNLLAETTLEYPEWEVGKTHRAIHQSFQVGGKGINVVKMLARLGAPATALCFPGGDSGRQCEQWLRDNGIEFQPFPTPGETRIGTVVRVPGKPETTFLGLDCVINPESVNACCDTLAAQPAGTQLVLCGVIQNWEHPVWNRLREELRIWNGHQRLAADTYGPGLRWMAELGVSTIKLNRVEFSTLLGERELAPADLPEGLQTAIESYSVNQWVVSDGGADIWYIERGSDPRSFTPPKIHEISPTGSGDVLFAGMLDGVLNRDFDLARSIEFGARMASASAALPGIADFPDEVITEALGGKGVKRKI